MITKSESGLVAFGIILSILGIALFVFGFQYNITIETSTTYLVSNKVVNLGLMQEQSNMIMIGCSMFLGGIITAGIGAILERLDK